MGIDARIEAVYADENGGGWLGLVDRPKRHPKDHAGIAGQSELHFEKSPHEVTAINGFDIWGGASTLMLGDRKIADRIGYARIQFVDREAFVVAVTEYRAARKQLEAS